MPPPESQIFKATYSGIPVYEMMCKGVAVMRRRSDSWLNATQILKVAGFDKPQRTRILEREVQKGEHEKVQGGYGKYQGTWIPVERGLELARQYNCETALMPIIDFTPAASSPPLAPKHLISTAAKPVRKDDSSTGIITRASRKVASDVAESEHDAESVHASEDGSMTPSPSEGSSSSRTPSPIPSPGRGHEPSHRGRKSRRTQERYDDQEEAHVYEGTAGDPAAYGEHVLEYFISDANQIPQFLINPPPDFDPNIAIDDDGHTALHWAAAMGRVRIVKLLLTASADIFKVNNAGQTALMRAVMFANNYDVRKFAELYELLHRSTLNIDHHNRTVFHHVVDVAMTKGKSHAARYYMETVLARLGDYPGEVSDVVNFQDEDGETALTLAARCRSKRLVKLLIDVGANPKIANNDGKSAEDYILEDERFRMSPVPAARAAGVTYRGAAPAGPATWTYVHQPNAAASSAPLHTSASAQRASTKAVNEVAGLLDGLAASFEAELREKERDKTQAHALLAHIQQEILESQRAVQQLKAQAHGLASSKQTIRQLEEELTMKMGRRYRQGWEQWAKEEEEREGAVRAELGARAGGAGHAGGSTTNGAHVDGAALPAGYAQGASEVSKGKRKAPPATDEELRDLEALHANIPTDPAQLKMMCDALREDVKQQQARRKGAFEALVKAQADAGAHQRMNEYRKLISVGLGGIPPGEVDGMLGTLLETLEQEEPTGSAVPWSTGPAPRAVPSI